MLSISRILALLAGAFISAVLLRKKENSPADAASWRPDLEALQKKFTEHLSAHDTRIGELQQAFAAMVGDLAAKSDAPIFDLAARLAELQPKIEAMAVELAAKPDARIDALAAHLTELQPKIEAIARELAAKPDSRIDALTARLSELQPWMEALAAKHDGRIDDLAARLSELQPRLEAIAAELAGNPDARIDHLATRLAAVESKANSTEEKLGDLQHKVGAHDLKLEATNHVVVAIEQLLNAKVAEFDRRIEAQGRSLQAMNSSIAQSDELLERILDLVQNLPPAAAEPVAIASGGGEIHELQM